MMMNHLTSIYARQWLLCFLWFWLVYCNEQTPDYQQEYLCRYRYIYHHVISFKWITPISPIYYHFVSMGIYPPNTAWSEYTISVQWQNLKTTKAHKCNKSPVKPFSPWNNWWKWQKLYPRQKFPTLIGSVISMEVVVSTYLMWEFIRSWTEIINNKVFPICIFELTAAHTQLWYHYSTCRSKLFLSTSHLR